MSFAARWRWHHFAPSVTPITINLGCLTASLIPFLCEVVSVFATVNNLGVFLLRRDPVMSCKDAKNLLFFSEKFALREKKFFFGRARNLLSWQSLSLFGDKIEYRLTLV